MNQYDDAVSPKRMNKPKQSTHFAHFPLFHMLRRVYRL